MTKIQNPQVQARRAAVSSFAGAVIEWYDFLLYGLVAATVFNTQFFPDVSPAIGVLAAFATFGVGFLFRPLGGLVFGHYGDRIGRKRTLVITMTIMGFATAGIGIAYVTGNPEVDVAARVFGPEVTARSVTS